MRRVSTQMRRKVVRAYTAEGDVELANFEHLCYSWGQDGTKASSTSRPGKFEVRFRFTRALSRTLAREAETSRETGSGHYNE